MGLTAKQVIAQPAQTAILAVTAQATPIVLPAQPLQKLQPAATQPLQSLQPAVTQPPQSQQPAATQAAQIQRAVHL